MKQYHKTLNSRQLQFAVVNEYRVHLWR